MDTVVLDEHEAVILSVLQTHRAYELAEYYLFNVERFCSLVLEVLNLGTLATKVFLVMYRRKRAWSTVELARVVKDHRSNVYVALRRLKAEGFVERASRTEWRVTPRSV